MFTFEIKNDKTMYVYSVFSQKFKLPLRFPPFIFFHKLVDWFLALRTCLNYIFPGEYLCIKQLSGEGLVSVEFQLSFTEVAVKVTDKKNAFLDIYTGKIYSHDIRMIFHTMFIWKGDRMKIMRVSFPCIHGIGWKPLIFIFALVVKGIDEKNKEASIFSSWNIIVLAKTFFSFIDVYIRSII